MNPDREIEINKKILAIVNEIKDLPFFQEDEELMFELDFYSTGLRRVLFHRIQRYEAHLYYLKSWKKKTRSLLKSLHLPVSEVPSKG